MCHLFQLLHNCLRKVMASVKTPRTDFRGLNLQERAIDLDLFQRLKTKSGGNFQLPSKMRANISKKNY